MYTLAVLASFGLQVAEHLQTLLVQLIAATHPFGCLWVVPSKSASCCAAVVTSHTTMRELLGKLQL